MSAYDFRTDALARTVPYGIYDITSNQGWVFVGTSSDTAEFAVEALVRWWQQAGVEHYPTARRLLILADGGGSNGHRLRAWKENLQRRLADDFGLAVTVCHYPTGCSKWNPIEHRLFGPISTNWAGIPLRTLETMLSLIRGTTTRTGLKVEATLIEGEFPTGRRISKRLMKCLDLVPASRCPKWNYTVRPRPRSQPPDPGSPFQRLEAWDLAALVC